MNCTDCTKPVRTVSSPDGDYCTCLDQNQPSEYIGVVTSVWELMSTLNDLIAEGKITDQTTLYVGGMHPAVDLEKLGGGNVCLNFSEREL